MNGGCIGQCFVSTLPFTALSNYSDLRVNDFYYSQSWINRNEHFLLGFQVGLRIPSVSLGVWSLGKRVCVKKQYVPYLLPPFIGLFSRDIASLWMLTLLKVVACRSNYYWNLRSLLAPFGWLLPMAKICSAKMDTGIREQCHCKVTYGVLRCWYALCYAHSTCSLYGFHNLVGCRLLSMA